MDWIYVAHVFNALYNLLLIQLFISLLASKFLFMKSNVYPSALRLRVFCHDLSICMFLCPSQRFHLHFSPHPFSTNLKHLYSALWTETEKMGEWQRSWPRFNLTTFQRQCMSLSPLRPQKCTLSRQNTHYARAIFIYRRCRSSYC